MAKNLKLNVKNAQLAAAIGAVKKLKPKEETALPEKEKKKEEKAETSAITQKRKSRIVQAPVAPLPPVSEPVVQEEVPSSSSAKEPEVEAHSTVKPTVSVAPPAPTPPGKHVETPPPRPAVEEQPLQRRKEPPKDLRLVKKKEVRGFDNRDRQGLRDADNAAWRKMRHLKSAKRVQQEEVVIRPKKLSIRLPITIKDLAQEMKLKASQLVAKLFMKGITLTLNDSLDDETVIQLLGHDFDCEISIDTSERERIQITGQTIKKEIEETSKDQLILRPPVVTFMGHVDHGKTSLIDAIRKSNRVASEAGAITQHIGAFKVDTKAGGVTILDTPGHEAFSEMRSRGATVTDIVILVVAGDEGIRAQTDEAIRQAREANVPILVAINKSDKPNFNTEIVFRELADRELLPEAWGGSTITVSCSAVTGEGIKELLEMIALQAEILELRANPSSRARGTVLESEMHKGMGAVATVLVQNGTLRKGDAIVFGHFSGRIKTLQDDYGRMIEMAGPSTPAKVTGLSELSLAGDEFIVVKNEKEARELAEARVEGHKRTMLQQVGLTGMEKVLRKKESGEVKILPLILRADVQGSLEALRNSLLKIHTKKARLEIVDADVGAISESDIELAAASKATVIGFHTFIETRAQEIIKQKKIPVFSHDVIYHIVDEVRVRMKALLDKIEQENEIGEVLVKAIFKSSQIGSIAGCQVTDGLVRRGSLVRQLRGKQIIWKGKIGSLKRAKDDVKEVQKGFECGIVLDGQTDVKEGDQFQVYELTYLEQDL